LQCMNQNTVQFLKRSYSSPNNIRDREFIEGSQKMTWRYNGINIVSDTA
jgi:hypothetical protein